MQIKRLIFSGGGIRVTAFIGALEVLEIRGIMKGIKEYVGVSAGALLGFLLAIGYTVSEIKTILFGIDLNIIRNLDPDLEHYGMDNGENLVKLFVSLLKNKSLPADIKFKDIKNLRIYASDLNNCCKREFSNELTPDVCVVEALRASCALPLYFTPVVDSITGNLLTDGGVISNYPIIHLTSQEIEESIGLAFCNDTGKKEITNLMEFMTQLLNTVLSRKTYNEFKKNTIFIDKGDYPSWNFEASLEDKQMLFVAGKEAALNFFFRNSLGNTLLGRKIKRRMSL